jgi:hypothetical protein
MFRCFQEFNEDEQTSCFEPCHKSNYQVLDKYSTKFKCYKIPYINLLGKLHMN